MATAEYRGIEREEEDAWNARVLPPPWQCFVPEEPPASVLRRGVGTSAFVSVARVGLGACDDQIDAVRTCV